MSCDRLAYEAKGRGSGLSRLNCLRNKNLSFRRRRRTEGRQVIDQRADERFDLLVADERDLRPPRVFQPRREEVDDLLGAVVIVHADFSEVVLRKLARQALESHQRRDRPHPQRRASA